MRNVRTMKSPQLAKVYKYIKEHTYCSTWDLIWNTKVVNPAGITSEINHNLKDTGQRIICDSVWNKNKKKMMHYYYLWPE